ncbi:MAG: hypothetical protein CMJ78_14890 [Planctomycetaceae bacterium]|nr:hypothetical protein [Planctomycetaceae bacterium]
MQEFADRIYTLDDLREFVHQTLCEKENLLADEFQLSEMKLMRRSRDCGLQFSIHGPRSVRLGAIWASDHNQLYFYDASGNRFAKIRLSNRLLPTADAA